MNLLQEREYYKPFNYPWAFEHYKTQQHMHWLPDEVPLADDLKDYREKMSDGQKKLLSCCYGGGASGSIFFATGNTWVWR